MSTAPEARDRNGRARPTEFVSPRQHNDRGVAAPAHDGVHATSELVVRSAGPKDLSAMATIWRQMMADHVALHPAFALADDATERWRDSIWEMLAAPDSFVFVAMLPHAIAGFCTGRAACNPTIYETRRVGLVCELAVCPAARRRRVGAALVAEARAWFAARALDEFQLSTALANDAGRAFWRAMGGEELLVRYRFTVR